ncbi:hypothetical protein ACWD00_40925 [Streptomyces viridiviolaceus]
MGLSKVARVNHPQFPVRTLPPAHVVAELAQTLIDITRYDGPALVEDAATRDTASPNCRKPTAAAVLTDLLRALEAALTTLEDCWEAAFADEQERIEPARTRRSPARTSALPGEGLGKRAGDLRWR